jgi:bacterioferritin (cytochrome b1)
VSPYIQHKELVIRFLYRNNTHSLEHAKQEMEHADRLAERIIQLLGEPNFSPDGLSPRCHAEYVESEVGHTNDLVSLLEGLKN